MIRARLEPSERITQGDVLSDVEYIEYVVEEDGILEISKIVFPFVVVLTQDCDLLQDYAFRGTEGKTQDKWLISVLFAPIYNAEHVFQGKHLSDIGITSQSINRNSTRAKLIGQNQIPRYHFLEFPEKIPVVPSVIDFKHYFSAPVLYLREHKKSNFVCTVEELYREDLSQRFAAFLSRIGLPDLLNPD